MPGHRKWSEIKRRQADGARRSLDESLRFGRTSIAVRYDSAIPDADAQAVQAAVAALVTGQEPLVRRRSDILPAIVDLVEARGLVATDAFENADLIEVVVRPA